jgi:hypothetical protein
VNQNKTLAVSNVCGDSIAVDRIPLKPKWIWASIDVYLNFLVFKNPEVSNPFSLFFTDSNESNPRKTKKGVQKKSKDASSDSSESSDSSLMSDV